MSEDKPQFRLSNDIEHFLAALSKLYTQDGERQKLEIIVNSQVRVHEVWTREDWGAYGHALYLTVPEDLYLSLVNQRSDLQSEIQNDINRIHNFQDEFIAAVFFEMEQVKDRDWRRESGVLQSGQRTITPSVEERIWGSGYRVFLSHKNEVKRETAELKAKLEPFGISSFVAHTDILPTKAWQDEIENALASMDAFIALLTDDFHDSDWTDQEVGYALARGVPMVAVKLGKDPYGFIGKFQALSAAWKDAPEEIVKLLIKYPRMLDAFIQGVPKCDSFDQGNSLSKVLASIESLTEPQAIKLASAYNNNGQLRGSFGFNGAKSWIYGPGLAAHLTRLTGKKYTLASSGEIELT